MYSAAEKPDFLHIIRPKTVSYMYYRNFGQSSALLLWFYLPQWAGIPRKPKEQYSTDTVSLFFC